MNVYIYSIRWTIPNFFDLNLYHTFFFHFLNYRIAVKVKDSKIGQLSVSKIL